MSQCADVLAFLSDGEPHEMRDIHRAVGFCRLNSRVAELRSKGHSIVCDKTGNLYVYRLLLEPSDAHRDPLPDELGGSLMDTSDGSSSETTGSSATHVEAMHAPPCALVDVSQLSLLEAAA